MKEMIVRIPDESVEMVEDFIEKIGGNAKITSTMKEDSFEINKERKALPTDFFGMFPDLNLDAINYRDELWRRKEY
jgi:hypothetical protein